MARTNPKRKNPPKNWEETLKKMNYALVGNTSAVQICRWTKNSLRGDRGCWKEKFYGISSAGCCEMTPSVMWCENKCLHCWRPIEMNLGIELPKIDDPKKILDKIVEERKKLLIGFKGRKEIDEKKFNESLDPKLYTMSLSGEPTLYPRLGEIFKEIRRRGAVSFLVTNGLNSQAIKNLKTDELPTQITVSTNAPNENLFNTWHRSCKKNAWNEFLKTLDVIKNLKGKVRRVIRLTLVQKGKNGTYKNLTNMSAKNIDEYTILIKKAEPDFIHIKGFMSVGHARKRFGYDKQPWFSEVKNFSFKLLKELSNYEFGAEDERSCVVMLKKKGIGMKIEKV
ncbi:MAG: radical SAM protein [Candidatus Pacearchaeota archaeon]